MSEYEYTPIKNKFWGFTEVPTTCDEELKEHLGVLIDPRIRIFQYNGDPRFKRLLSFLLSKLDHSNPLTGFLEDPKERGRYIYHESAVFVKPNDPFALCHELGHVLIHSKNPDLIDDYAGGFLHPRKIDDSIAGFALDEGMAQWIAINVGLKTMKYSRVTEAMKESNKLVADPNNQTNLLYDSTILKRNIEDVKQAHIVYRNNPVVRNNSVPESVCNIYQETLDTIYKKIMSLGYVHTASMMGKLSLYQPRLTISEKLSQIIKNPPTFKELKEEVLAFKGFSQSVTI